MTMGKAFDRTLERFPDREALVVGGQGQRNSWSHLRAKVDRCARGLGLEAALRHGLGGNARRSSDG
jgi:fatty-acyl-CoA synthase